MYGEYNWKECFIGAPLHYNSQWGFGDSEENFKSNLKNKETRVLLEDGDWISRSFDYKTNSYGFRCPEFKSTKLDSIVFLGCSHTLGVGLPYKSSWPYIVSKKLELLNYNLAQPGFSADGCFRIGYHWIPKLKPKVAVFLVPSMHRIELFGTINYQGSRAPVQTQYGGWTNGNTISEKFYLQDWIAHKENLEYNRIKNIKAFQAVCYENNTTPIVLTVEDDLNLFVDQINTGIRLPMARDLSHNGETINEKFAKEVLNKIKSELI